MEDQWVKGRREIIASNLGMDKEKKFDRVVENSETVFTDEK